MTTDGQSNRCRTLMALVGALCWDSGVVAVDSVPVVLTGHHWDSTKVASLEPFAGQVVILDFFAHWCAPCRKVTSDLEKKIQQFYAARGGNAGGHPVRVLSVNVELSACERTAAYIRQTGPSLVVTDIDGLMQKAYNVNAPPTVVVLDGTGQKWRIVQHFTGRPDLSDLKRLIDSLGVSDARPPMAPAASPNRNGRLVSPALPQAKSPDQPVPFRSPRDQNSVLKPRPWSPAMWRCTTAACDLFMPLALRKYKVPWRSIIISSSKATNRPIPRGIPFWAAAVGNTFKEPVW